jgi:hypothetical protein
VILSAADDGSVRLAVKAVPGSRMDQVAGPLGDRLKVKVAAPPEDGRANAAICALIAGALGVKPRDVTVVSGHAHAEKVLRLAGVTLEAARARLGVP